ncbi:MAG TPA: SpoIIE family protein phosphatase, partial [Bacteroidia bacterium]|nr:SpoIIE family protein phosphatase [Bacteroidia bacterium]
VLFMPKDIVSGDFYFMHRNDPYVFLAAADCTGHGVPGAFMSLIGCDKLESAVLQSSDTGTILQLLNKGLKASLRQTAELDSTRDGMDIGLCRINRQTLELHFSGANRPLWIIRKGSNAVEEIKGTKKGIGGHTEDGELFPAQSILLQKGDSIYLFSDGYADLFGGPGNKKMTSRKFREILLGMPHQSLEEQGSTLRSFALEWKGNREQVDDILIIGVRV